MNLSHWTVFKTKGLNEFWGRVIGFFMLFPRDFDLIMHYSHHRFTQNWDKDGELVREPYTLKTFLLWMIGITYWRNRIWGILRRARGVIIEPYIHANEEAKVIREIPPPFIGLCGNCGGVCLFPNLGCADVLDYSVDCNKAGASIAKHN